MTSIWSLINTIDRVLVMLSPNILVVFVGLLFLLTQTEDKTK